MPNNMQNPQNGQMHPEDRKNMILFLVICVVGFLAYDHFIHTPQMETLQAQQAAVQAAASAPAPVADALANTEPVSVEAAIAENSRIEIESPHLIGSINLSGGRIDDLSLRDYFETLDNKTPVRLLAPAHTDHPLYADFGWMADAGSDVRMPDATSVWRIKAGSAKTLSTTSPVTIEWRNGQGLTFERTYSLDDEYMFSVSQRVTNATRKTISLHPYAALTRRNLPADFMNNAVMHEGPIGYFNEGLIETEYSELDKEKRQSFDGVKGWAGFTDKYWFSGIIPADDANYAYRFVRAAGNDAAPVYQADMSASAISIAPGASASHSVHVFSGPKKLRVLNEYKEKLGITRFDLVIDFGRLWFLTIPFFHVLTWLGHTIGSFAVAILVFTVLLRLAVFPLANKSYRSFARMRKIQPQMIEVREKYADDRQRMQQAIFELYKKEEVNPMAGCLPLLLQIPIFFALYKVLYITLEMRHAPFFGWVHDMSVPDPLSPITLFGLINWDPPSFINIGVWPLIMGLTLVGLQRLNPPAQDPAQARMMQFMPILMTLLMAHMPAGLVIYWSWSNCISIIQQSILMRQEGVEVSLFSQSAGDKKMENMVAHGPSVHPAAEEISRDLDAIEGKIIEKEISAPKKGGKGGKKRH